MIGIIGIVALLTVLSLSLLITRLASVALMMTGLSREAALFQVRSAFTGTGFTTKESEGIVGHPVRRRIVALLMVVRSAGLITVVISVVLSFAGARQDVDLLIRLLWLIGGVGAVTVLAHLPLVDRGVEWIMGRALSRWTSMNVCDYARLLDLVGKYAVTKLRVEDGDWLADRELRECDLMEEGVTVLGIQRDRGRYVGVPRGATSIHAGDTLILYGRDESIRELDHRRRSSAGDAAHRRAIGDQQRHMREQDEQERGHERKRRERDGAGRGDLAS